MALSDTSTRPTSKAVRYRKFTSTPIQLPSHISIRYNVYGGNKDIKAVFGDVPRFIRWRVKLMEETVAQCDFVTVDQTVQIHGMVLYIYVLNMN